MDYVINPPKQVVLQVSNRTALFPVNRIFCVGRNYAAHAQEMGGDPDRDPPFFFMKPANAAVAVNKKGADIHYPSMTRNYQHEIELVAAIGKAGFNIEIEKAKEHVFGYAVGLDMTRRDLQLDARDKGRPWEFGKSFLKSAPIGAICPTSEIGHPSKGEIGVKVNGVVKQLSDLDKLLWSVPEIIAYLSKFEALIEGDLIMTGTPEGVDTVNIDDELYGWIDGVGSITVRIIGNGFKSSN